jgi:hypothetical protein
MHGSLGSYVAQIIWETPLIVGWLNQEPVLRSEADGILEVRSTYGGALAIRRDAINDTSADSTSVQSKLHQCKRFIVISTKFEPMLRRSDTASTCCCSPTIQSPQLAGAVRIRSWPRLSGRCRSHHKTVLRALYAGVASTRACFHIVGTEMTLGSHRRRLLLMTLIQMDHEVDHRLRL